MAARGQIALEYMGAVAILLVMLAALVAYSFSLYYETVNIEQLTTSLKNLERGAKHVYSLGPGNTIFVDLVLTKEVVGSRIDQGQGQSAIVFELSDGSESSAVVDVNITNLASSPLPSSPGAYVVKIEADANGEGVTISNVT